jgi:hypothetical protein
VDLGAIIEAICHRSGPEFERVREAIEYDGREARDARLVMEEMGLPVMATEIPQLSFYSDAFGEPVGASLGEYAQVATELQALVAA